eukprot:scaffold14653_cov66-Phaeocystis_antarctica.AAC.8
MIYFIAAHGVDLAVKHHRGVALARHAHARHQSPSAELWIIGLDRFQYCVAAISTDGIDLATDRGQSQCTACSAHLGQRLPAIGLRVIHLRRVELLRSGSNAAHGIELALQSDAAVRGAWAHHSCLLRPRGVLRVVQLHRAELSAHAVVAAHNVDQAGPEARARHHFHAVHCRHHCVEEHVFRLRRAQRRPNTYSLAQEPRRHRREAHVPHHRKQLGLGPLAGLPPPLDPLEDGLLALGHQPVLLHQRQHLRARRQLRRQLLEAAQCRLHRGLLKRRQREGVGEPPHVERVGRSEPRTDGVGARFLQRVDHQARGRLEHLGQQALVDLTLALVDKGQQRLEHGRADALEREIARARGERHPVRLELDALGADGEVGEPVIAPEGDERGLMRYAPHRVSLVPAASSGDEEDEAAAAAAVRARFFGGMRA